MGSIVFNMRKLYLAVAVLSLFVACSKAGSIQPGSKATLNYTLKVDGTVVDTSQGKEPLKVEIGSHQVIPGFEENLIGLKKGAKKSFTVAPDKGYGMPDPNLVQTVKKADIHDGDKIQEGSVLSGQTPDGNMFQARVTKIDGDNVTLDLNSPMAGKTLNFEVEIVDVASAAPVAAPAAPDTQTAPAVPAPEVPVEATKAPAEAK